MLKLKRLYALTLVGVVAWPVSLTAQVVKLSSTPLTGVDVIDFRLTPDGSRVVYLADLVAPGLYELFSTTTLGGGPQYKLGTVFASGAAVQNFQLTPDGSRVVYIADFSTNDVFELYSALTTTSGTQVMLSSTPLAGGDVVDRDFELTSDGARVVYIGDLTTDSVDELYSASTTASGTQVKLSSSPLAVADVSSLQLTPDGNRVIYRGDLVGDETYDLFSTVAAGGGAQFKLSSIIPAFGDANHFELTPDGSRVIYWGDLSTNNIFEIYSTPNDASGAQVKISSTTAGSTYFSFRLTPDGTRAVYQGDMTSPNVIELYSASTATSGTQIPLSSSASGGYVDTFTLTSDGSRAIYLGYLDNVFALYSASTTESGTQVKLSSANIENVTISSDFQLTPDGSRVVYRAELSTDSVMELYSASTNADGTQITLSLTSSAHDVFDFQLSPDGSRVVYRVTSDDGSAQLYSASTMESGAQRELMRVAPNESSSWIGTEHLSAPPVGGNWIDNIQISDDSQSVAFLVGTHPLEGNQFVGKDLYWASLACNCVLHLASAFSEITAFEFVGDTIVFTGDVDTPGMSELYSIVPEVPLPEADSNFDSNVDAADYVWWRKFNCTQEAYDNWRSQFGEPNASTGGSAGRASGHSNAHEPTSAALLLLSLVPICGLFRRRPLTAATGRFAEHYASRERQLRTVVSNDFNHAA